jgi:hypothetical protein
VFEDPEGKRVLVRLRLKWEDNTEMDLREMKLEGVAGFTWFKIVSSGGLL